MCDLFFNLHNAVSSDMGVFKRDIDDMINTQYTQSTHCTHSISSDVLSTRRKLKHDKNDGDSDIVSDHIIYSVESLSVHITILFAAMLRHHLTPDGMLTCTMIPHSKMQMDEFVHI